MPELWRLEARVRASIGVNQFFYRLRKIPLIKKLIPEEIFGAYGLKSTWRYIHGFLRVLMDLVKRMFWYAILYAACFIRLKHAGLGEMPIDFTVLAPVFFFLMILGNTGFSMLDATDSQVVYVVDKYYVRDTRAYGRLRVLRSAWRFLFYHGAVLYLASLITPAYSTRLFYALPLIVALRFFVTRVELARLEKVGKRALPWQWTVPSIVVPLILTIVYLMGGINPHVTSFFSLPMFLAGLILAGIGLVLLWRYSRYDLFVSDECANLEGFLTGTLTQGLNERTEKDFDASVPKGIEHKHGYDALHALFFHRNAKRFRKSLRNRLATVAIGIAVLMVGCYAAQTFFGVAVDVAPLFTLTGVWLYVMLLALFRENFTRELFLQMDRFLFVHPFYRKRNAVMRSFWLRFRVLCMYNLAIAALVALGGFITGKLFSATVPTAWYGIILGSAAFFSIHTIGCYVLFQPYTFEMKAHSVPYTISNLVVSMTCWLFYTKEFRTNPKLLTIVGVVALVWSAALLTATYFFAPKTFKPRD